MTANQTIISIVLLVLTSLSFFDQYQQMVQLGNNEGLSSRYLLLNLISATEQLALGLHTILVNGGGGNDGIVVPTPGLPNYLNLAQFALFWFWQLLLFAIFLYYCSQSTQRWLLLMYATLFVAILVPVFLEATTSASNDQNHDLRWTSALLTYVHCTLVNPVVTILEFVALIAQFRQLQSRSHLGALSTNTLAAQAVVFALVALSWLKRITMSVHIRPSNGHQVLVWYQVVGWAAIDNAIFAFSQAVLWWKARQLPRYLDAENTPLLTAERAV